MNERDVRDAKGPTGPVHGAGDLEGIRCSWGGYAKHNWSGWLDVARVSDVFMDLHTRVHGHLESVNAGATVERRV